MKTGICKILPEILVNKTLIFACMHINGMTSITFLSNSLALNTSEHFVAISVQVYYFSTFLHMKISLLDDNTGMREL